MLDNYFMPDMYEPDEHEELLAKDGFYAQLYNSQFEDAGE